jgi:hypothetical protein
MLRKALFRQVAPLLATVLSIHTVSAQTPPATTSAHAPVATGWTFSVSPYFWMTGLRGNVGASSSLPPSSIDVSFSDIFNHLDGPSVFLSGEAWNGRFGILGDVQYVKLKANASTPGPLFDSATAKQWNFNSTIEGAYRVVDSPTVAVDGLVGVRIFHVDNQIDLNAALLPTRSSSIGDTWSDPVIGARLTVPFATGFTFTGYGDVGSFGISSDRTWELYAGIGYRFKDWLTAYAGYRYLDIKRSNGGFLYDVSEQGPLLGAQFRF